MALRYVRCLRWLMEIPDKPAATALLYAALHHDARFPPRKPKSLQKYADETGFSIMSIRRARAWLIKHQIIDVKPGRTYTSPPEYVVYEPPLHATREVGVLLSERYEWSVLSGMSTPTSPVGAVLSERYELFPSEVLEVKEGEEAPGLSPLCFAFRKRIGETYGKTISDKELRFFNPLFVAGVPVALAVDEIGKHRLRDAPWEHADRIEKAWEGFKAEMVQLRQFYAHGIGPPPSPAPLAQMERYLSAEGIKWVKGEEPHAGDPEPPR